MRRNHRWRKRFWRVGAVLAVILTSAAVWTFHRWQARGPHQASVSAAVDRFRSSSTLPWAHRTLTPAAGVYTYRGAGEEQLSFLSTTQSQGPELPATVVVDHDGCWTFEIQYNSFHRQSWEWCERGGKLVERGGTTHQKFDFVAIQVDETSQIVCEPPFVLLDPDARAGSARDALPGPIRDHRHRNVIRRFHPLRRPRYGAGRRCAPACAPLCRRPTLTGDQQGHEHLEMWLSPEDGLPLRNERDLTVVSPAPRRSTRSRTPSVGIGSWRTVSCRSEAPVYRGSGPSTLSRASTGVHHGPLREGRSTWRCVRRRHGTMSNVRR